MNKKVFYSIGILFLVAIIGISLWSNFRAPSELDDQLQGQSIVQFPSALLGIPLTAQQSGQDAMGMLDRMHGTQIRVEQGYIVSYQQGEKEIILYLSESPTVDEAAELFRIMDQKMPASQVFLNRQAVQVDGQQVIKVVGMGMDHYYWQQSTVNYWVAVKGEISREELIQEVIAKVKL